ncbi:glycosyltransferase family 4 protein [Candidatus Dependentiae bacterium]|nr:glycosyltransferase family 4 protein [Candidatus Dependentiae bacterium]
MKIAVAAGGRFHAFHLAHQLQRYDVLHGLYTASYRQGDENYVPEQKIFYNKSVGFWDNVYNSFGGRYIMNPASWYVMKDRWFDEWFDEKLHEAKDIDIVVGWAHYVEKSIATIKNMGAKLVIESGSMHILEQQRIIQEEAERWGVKPAAINSENCEKMLKEYALADYISVPSSHVKQSFIDQGVSPHKLILTPYGVDVDQFYVSRLEQPKKFKVVFVGMLSLQKGIGYLLEAWKRLNLPASTAELTIIGSPFDFTGDIMVSPSVNYVGSVRQADLKKWYSEASLLVLPSVQDGWGMVYTEALAAGVPVLCTDRTGAQDVIESGAHGFIVPHANTDALVEKIGWAYAHQEDLYQMGLAGQSHVKKYSWNAYGKKIVRQYARILANQ